jgi:disulfide bond formation protein DsbB
MEFTALFLAVTAVMLVAWRGPRSLALTLFRRRAARLGRDLPAPCHRYAEAVVLRPLMTRAFAVTLNAVSLYAVALVLAAAFAAQLLLHELPCPLCLLQRLQFAMLAIGPVMNVRWGPRPSHYALSLLAAAVGMAFSTRQVLLHIMPGDAGYGTALFGYHYYTLALIGFVIAIVLLAAILLFDRPFEPDGATPPVANAFARAAVWLVIGLTALNVVSTLLECGFGACAENPVVYELLKGGA